MKKHILSTLIVLLTVFFIGVLSFFITDKMISEKEVTRLQEDVYISNQLSDATISANNNTISDEFVVDTTKYTSDFTSESVVKTDDRYVSPIDFDRLKKSNPDIFAWISIPDTVVNYPIVQHPTDDSYYLKHGPDGMYSAYGCPYIELTDSGSFLEFNTVIYGHNMNDGTMFASLHEYESRVFFDQHREIDVYTPEHRFTYAVFAAVMYSDAHIPYYFNDLIESDRTSFLKSLKENSILDRSIIATDLAVTEDDCIITLSTCDKKLRDNRFLVVAVLKQIDGQDA